MRSDRYHPDNADVDEITRRCELEHQRFDRRYRQAIGLEPEELEGPLWVDHGSIRKYEIVLIASIIFIMVFGGAYLAEAAIEYQSIICQEGC